MGSEMCIRDSRCYNVILFCFFTLCSLCFRFWHGFLDLSQEYLGMIPNAEDINSYEDAHMYLYPYQYEEDDDGENGENGGSGESDIADGEGSDINGDGDGGNAGGDGSDGDNRGDGEDAVSVVSSDA